MENNIYRFQNWREYVQQQNILPKNSDTIVLILCYNQIDNVKKICTFYSEQPVDILFVDNHSNDGTFEFLLENYKDKFNIIRTKENLGGAGGFALGIEFVVSRGYDYCILTEEDAIPLDKDIIEEMLRYKNKNVEVLTKYYELNRSFFAFHFHLYPTWLFKKVGIPNKNLFFRADDWEYKERIENFLRTKKGFRKIVIDKYYSHPLIKRGFGILSNYFKFRNSLFVYSIFPKKNKFISIGTTLVKHIWNGVFSLFYDRNICWLLQVKDGFCDFLRLKLPNKRRIEQYRKCKLKPKNYKIKELELSEFIDKYKEYRLVSNILRSSIIGDKFGNSLSCFIGDKFNNSGRILCFLARKIIFIEEIDFINEKVHFIEYGNNQFVTISLLGLSLIISLIICCGMFPFVLINCQRIKKLSNAVSK